MAKRASSTSRRPKTATRKSTEARSVRRALAPGVNFLTGYWITSFELEFPEVPSFGGTVLNSLFPPNWKHTVFLSRYEFADDYTFRLFQYRNKGGEYEERFDRTGQYTLEWIAGVAGGDMRIDRSSITLRYFMRNANELHFMVTSSDPRQPIGQGTMYRAEILEPAPIEVPPGPPE